MTTLAFVDCETTGLDPDRHDIWEVGLILRRGSETTEHQWFLPVDLGSADPNALDIGRYYERHPAPHDSWNGNGVTMLGPFAQDFSMLTHGAYLVGAVVSFDEERLRRLLRDNAACPGWDYHLIDVRALAAGAVGAEPPWHFDSIEAKLGVTPTPPEERHTALGDARMAMRIYDAAMA